MSKVLGRFRKRNIQTNFYQFVLVIFVVAVSVCLITGLIINYLTLSRSLDRLYENSHMPTAWVKAENLTKEDETFLSSFEYGKRYNFESSFEAEYKSYDGKFIVSDGKVSTPYIIEGEREAGCYVDYTFAKENRIGLNHTLVYLDYFHNGETKQIWFKVVGFISMAEDLIADGDAVIFIEEKNFLKTLKAFFPETDENDLSQIKYNEVLVESKLSEESLLQIKDRFGENNVTEFSELESVKKLDEEILISQKMLVVFPSIFVIVSILVIVSAIGQLVLKERYNIGLLKSMGYSNKQIFSNYSGYGAFIGFIGAGLGLALSALIIPNMTFEVYDKLYNLPRDEMKLSFPILTAVIVVVTSTLIGAFSSLFASLWLKNKTPKECMSKLSNSSLKSRQKKSNISFVICAPARNMKINLSRTIMSVVGLSGSALLILLGFGSQNLLGENKGAKELYSLAVFSKVFKGFSIALMILSVLILIAQIFKEREKEMAMRRILGESYIKIWLSVLLEMAIIGVVGFMVSAILSVPTMLLNAEIFGIDKFLAIDFLSYLKTFLLVFFVILFIASFALIKIYRLKLCDAIKFSE